MPKMADASKGRGGNIRITTQGILGLQYRDQLTLDNDINASSEFGVNGTVQVNTISVDPNSGLTALPVDIIDPSQQIAKGCDSTQGSSFIITGRGGIPSNPTQELPVTRPWNDLRSLDGMARSGDRPTRRQAVSTLRPELIEATTWQVNAQGHPELVAAARIADLSAVTCAQ